MSSGVIKKIRFLPHKESRLINQMWRIAMDCFSYAVYFRQISEISFNEKNEYWSIQTQNAYYDLAVINWCKLFGSRLNEPIHYHKLLSLFKKELQEIDVKLCSRAKLMSYILDKIKISGVEYKKFHTEVLKYRNRNLIHPEHDPDKINDGDLKYPLLQIILLTVFALLQLLSTLLSSCPVVADKFNQYGVEFCIFENKKKLITYIQSCFPAGL